MVIRKFPRKHKVSSKSDSRQRGREGGTLCSVAIESMKSCRVEEDPNQWDLRGTRRWEGKRSTSGASWKRVSEEEEELGRWPAGNTVGRMEKERGKESMEQRRIGLVGDGRGNWEDGGRERSKCTEIRKSEGSQFALFSRPRSLGENKS